MAVIGNIDTESNKKNTAGDLKNVPQHAPADVCVCFIAYAIPRIAGAGMIRNVVCFPQADAIIRAGATRQREIYHPLGQGLHTMAVLRPLFLDLVDFVVTAMIV